MGCHLRQREHSERRFRLVLQHAPQRDHHHRHLLRHRRWRDVPHAGRRHHPHRPSRRHHVLRGPAPDGRHRRPLTLARRFGRPLVRRHGTPGRSRRGEPRAGGGQRCQVPGRLRAPQQHLLQPGRVHRAAHERDDGQRRLARLRQQRRWRRLGGPQRQRHRRHRRTDPHRRFRGLGGHVLHPDMVLRRRQPAGGLRRRRRLRGTDDLQRRGCPQRRADHRPRERPRGSRQQRRLRRRALHPHLHRRPHLHDRRLALHGCAPARCGLGAVRRDGHRPGPGPDPHPAGIRRRLPPLRGGLQ